jgi:hypothetical protein
VQNTPESFVDAYLAEVEASAPGAAMDVSRLVVEPSGLDAAGMIAAISDPRLDRLGIPMLADFMAPEGSIYFDAIFGAYHGQAAIRAWLVPAMAEIEFIEFVPKAESVIFEDGAEGTSLDEWQMVANVGDEQIPLSRGVSVRRHADGWITWACDVYDTAAFRLPPPPEMEIEGAAPLPDCPQVDWPILEGATVLALSERANAWAASSGAPVEAGSVTDRPSGLGHDEMLAVLTNPAMAADVERNSSLFHPTDSLYIDPLLGELSGQASIRAALSGQTPRLGGVGVEPIGSLLFDGTTAVQEWVHGTLRGTSVRRFADGWVTYAADYFDTAALS